MIEGIYVQLPHTKLADLLRVRADFHEQKAAQHKKRLEKLKEVQDEDSEMEELDAGYANTTQNSKAQGIKNSVAIHVRQAAYFRFIADNLITEEYRLSQSDLMTLELLSR